MGYISRCRWCQFPSACAEESCHVTQQKCFFWKHFPMFLAHDGELSHLHRWVWYADFHSCSVVFQSLKSVKDLNTNNRQSLRICKFIWLTHLTCSVWEQLNIWTVSSPVSCVSLGDGLLHLEFTVFCCSCQVLCDLEREPCVGVRWLLLGVSLNQPPGRSGDAGHCNSIFGSRLEAREKIVNCRLSTP